MLFCERARRGQRKTALGRLIAARVDPETIARFIQALVRDRGPEPAQAAAAASAPGVEGNLAQIALAELLQLFHVNRKTGMVELRESGGRRAAAGRIELLDGDVTQARIGSVEGEKALFRLLAWRRGSFAFRQRIVARDRNAIQRPTRALLREGSARSRSGSGSAVELPPPHAHVTLTSRALVAAERAPPAHPGSAPRARALVPRRRRARPLQLPRLPGPAHAPDADPPRHGRAAHR